MASDQVLEAKPWDPMELIFAEAKDFDPSTGPLGECNLQQTENYPLHNFFERDSWKSVGDEDYDLLLPSMQLASNLLQVGLPYLCSFVPSSRAHDHLSTHRAEDPDYYQINVGGDWSAQEMEETRQELYEIAEEVQWELNYTIAKDNRWLGVTRLVTDVKWGPRPWKDLQKSDIQRSDQELDDQGAERRPLIVGIMQQYANALSKYPSPSEAYLRAVFLTAITMVHEVGHVVWHQDFRSVMYDKDGIEPYVGDYSISELGCCFIANIFSGKMPCDCDRKVPTDFTEPLCWEKIPTMDTNELFRTDHSIPIAYLEKIVSQDNWNKLDPNIPDFTVQARAWLEPGENISFLADGNAVSLPKDEPATAVLREWTLTQSSPGVIKPIWKTKFADRRVRTEHKLIKDLSQAQINLAKREIRDENPGAFVDGEPENKVRFGYDFLNNPDTRPVDDGVLPLDLHTSGDNLDLDRVVRIEVQYKPKLEDLKDVNVRRARPPPHQPQPVTRETPAAEVAWFSNWDTGAPRYDVNKPQDYRFDSLRARYAPRRVLELIANKQPAIIAKSKIKDIYKFCMDRGITVEVPLPATYIEQEQTLDLTSEHDRALIERIRQFCLGEAEKLFVGDSQALLYIYYAQAKYIDDWTMDDLKKQCVINGLNHRGTIDVVRDRVRNNMVRFLKLFAKDKKMVATEQVFKDAGLVDDIDLLDWTDKDFQDFFKINSLSCWGNRRIWFERHAAFQREQYSGPPRIDVIDYDSKDEITRSINGVERYAWDVTTAGSSVQALKGALFTAGHFPSNSTLNLYIGNNRQITLEDSNPLAYYEPLDWTTLTLEITRPSPPDTDTLMTDADPTILLYIPRVPAGTDISFALPTDLVTPPSSSPSSTSDSDKDPTTIPPPFPIPHEVQRIYNLNHHLARPTVVETLDAIHTSASELTSILHPLGARDTLRPHLTSLRATSAVEIYDSYQDMVEVREERKRHIDLQVDPARVLEDDKVKRRKVLQDLRPDLVFDESGKLVDGQVDTDVDGEKGGKRGGGSHMVDLVRGLRGLKVLPPAAMDDGRFLGGLGN